MSRGRNAILAKTVPTYHECISSIATCIFRVPVPMKWGGCLQIKNVLNRSGSDLWAGLPPRPLFWIEVPSWLRAGILSGSCVGVADRNWFILKVDTTDVNPEKRLLSSGYVPAKNSETERSLTPEMSRLKKKKNTGREAVLIYILNFYSHLPAVCHNAGTDDFFVFEFFVVNESAWSYISFLVRRIFHVYCHVGHFCQVPTIGLWKRTVTNNLTTRLFWHYKHEHVVSPRLEGPQWPGFRLRRARSNRFCEKMGQTRLLVSSASAHANNNSGHTRSIQYMRRHHGRVTAYPPHLQLRVGTSTTHVMNQTHHRCDRAIFSHPKKCHNHPGQFCTLLPTFDQDAENKNDLLPRANVIGVHAENWSSKPWIN